MSIIFILICLYFCFCGLCPVPGAEELKKREKAAEEEEEYQKLERFTKRLKDAGLK